MALDGFAWTAPQPKAPRGSGLLAREKDAADRKAHAREVANKVKARDGYRCRWPGTHKCRGGLEAAHIRDKSLCGPNETGNEISLCAWIHRRGPESIHGKQLKVECDTPFGADSRCSFWRKDDAGAWYLVAREVVVGSVERD